MRAAAGSPGAANHRNGMRSQILNVVYRLTKWQTNGMILVVNHKGSQETKSSNQ